jgi:hypothetical protein
MSGDGMLTPQEQQQPHYPSRGEAVHEEAMDSYPGDRPTDAGTAECHGACAGRAQGDRCK